MSLNIAKSQQNSMRGTIDTILLSTLLNKHVNAGARVFNVKSEFLALSKTWQVFVEHFKSTYIVIDADKPMKSEDMYDLAAQLAEKLMSAMTPRKEAKLPDAKVNGVPAAKPGVKK